MSFGRGALKADAGLLTSAGRTRREISMARQTTHREVFFNPQALATASRYACQSVRHFLRQRSTACCWVVSWRSSPPWHRHRGGGRLRPFGARESDPWNRGPGRGVVTSGWRWTIVSISSAVLGLEGSAISARSFTLPSTKTVRAAAPMTQSRLFETRSSQAR